jgi:translocation and assembly module TamA
MPKHSKYAIDSGISLKKIVKTILNLTQPHLAVRTLLLIACLWAHNTSARMTLTISGIEDNAIEEQLNAYLVIPEGTEFDDSNFLKSLTKKATEAMQAIGYYSPQFVFENKVNGEDVDIKITVSPGKPVRVSEFVLEISGGAQDETTFKKMKEAEKMAVREIFNHGHYETLKSTIINIAQTQGYFDGRFERSTVRLDVATNSAYIDLHFASGKRYALGEVYFVGLSLESSIIRHWVTFKPGTPYQSKLVANLTNTLLDSGFFSNVRVVPERAKSIDGVIPVRVELTDTADNTINFGIGFATDSGPRGRISLDKPKINHFGHSFHSELASSQIRQSISASYKIPFPEAPRTHFYVIETGALEEKFDTRVASLFTVSGQRVSLTKSSWQQTESLRWEDHQFTVSGITRKTTLYVPGIAWSRTKRRGGIFSTWGNRYSLRLQGASRSLASDVDLVKVVAGAKWLRSFSNNHYFLFRTELGALETNEFERLPLSNRFFAGGDQSIRGFDYQTIGPKDSAGNAIGGRYIAVGSAEVVFGINDRWGWALFSDAGKAFNNSGEKNSIGMGAGLRWQSPVGPLRIDVAVGVSEDDNPIRLHLAFGPEL